MAAAENKNGILNRCFPFYSSLVTKSGVPDGAELAARVGIADADSPQGPGRIGRPREPLDPVITRLKRLVDPGNPLATSFETDRDDDSKILAGSVLQLLLPNGDYVSVVLLNDVGTVRWSGEDAGE